MTMRDIETAFLLDNDEVEMLGVDEELAKAEDRAERDAEGLSESNIVAD